MIALKRVYEPAGAEDGVRLLVERLWPRGMRKDALKMDAWMKDVAPSTDLRRWFGHEPARWGEFCQRYAAELEARPDSWAPIVQAHRAGTVTLLYSSHDVEHNNAVALKAYLEGRPSETRQTVKTP